LGWINEAAHLAQITAALATTTDFEQAHASCAICHESKKVICSTRVPYETAKESREFSMTDLIHPLKPRPGETAAEFLKRRAGNAKPSDMLKILTKVPDVPPTGRQIKARSFKA
jgi:hypothetical protein